MEEALAGTTRLGQQEQLQADVQTRAQESLRLADIRYKTGADDLLTMLDAQRTLFAAQDQLAQIQLSRLQAAVSLYKARRRVERGHRGGGAAVGVSRRCTGPCLRVGDWAQRLAQGQRMTLQPALQNGGSGR